MEGLSGVRHTGAAEHYGASRRIGRQYSSEADFALSLGFPPVLLGLVFAVPVAKPPAVEPVGVPRDCAPKDGTLEAKLLGSFNRDSLLEGIGDWRANSF